MRNASRPSGYLKTDKQLRQDTADAMRERWNLAHGGDGAGGTAVLEQGLEYVKIDLADLQNLAANETAKLGVGDVARLFNIPPSLMLGVEQNRATASEDRRRLLSFAVAPLARMVEDCLNVALLSPVQLAQGFAVRVDTSVEMLGQGNEMAQAVSGLLNGGAVSVNEVRARLGLANVENGDALRSPTNTWPLDNWINATPASGDPAAAASSEQQALSVGSDAGTRRALQFYKRRLLR
jgi:HK97 family phage portal protein